MSSSRSLFVSRLTNTSTPPRLHEHDILRSFFGSSSNSSSQPDPPRATPASKPAELAFSYDVHVYSGDTRESFYFKEVCPLACVASKGTAPSSWASW